MQENTPFMRDDFMEYQPKGLTLYESIHEHLEEYADMPAMSYYGIKTSYTQLFEKIDEVERALRAMGIGKDDVVAASLPGMPEAVTLIYAINKIGAVYCAFDCRSKEPEILETVKTFAPKLMVVPDFQVKLLKNIHDTPVVYVDMTHAIGGPMVISGFVTDLVMGRKFVDWSHKNIFSYDAFLKKGKGGENLPPQHATDDVFGYFYTSGTTYGRKSIILTNEHVNAACIQFNELYGNREHLIEKGGIILNIMPLFTCYGMTIATHLPLLVGVRVKLVPLLNTKKMKEKLIKEHPNFIITVPAHWEHFVKEDFTDVDLSFLKLVVVGGDTINPEYEDRINAIFKQCGSQAWLHSGYGLSETTSSGTAPAEGNPKGSVGKALPYTLVGIFDHETGKPLPTGEKGEICIWGPTLCHGYYGDPVESEKLLRLHDDGKVWLHSGDIGYLDEDGYLYFCERIKRMYVRHDGTKVSPYAAEQIMAECPCISRILITGVKDPRHTHGKYGKALIVLREGIPQKQAEDQIAKYMKDNLDAHLIPREIVYVEKLPYTKMGKLDYFAAEKIGSENATEEKK